MVAMRWSGTRKRKLSAGGARGRRKIRAMANENGVCGTEGEKMNLGVIPYNLEDDKVRPLDERGKILGLTRGHVVKNIL
jgi:hypothetical protein